MAEKREFKVHDHVIIPSRYGSGGRVGRVVRTTKTQAIVQFEGSRAEVRYRLDSGYAVGRDRSPMVRPDYIRHVTDKDRQDIAWDNLKGLAGRLDKIAEEYGRKDAVLQLQIMADKFIAHINETEDQK